MNAYGSGGPARGLFRRIRLGIAALVVALGAVAAMPAPAHAAGKIAFGPNNLTIAEGGSDQITVLLDDQSATETGTVDLPLVASDPSRVSLTPANVHFDFDGTILPPQYFTITVVDDSVHNSSNTITIKSTASSSSDYYRDYEVNLTLTIQDNDGAPTSTTQQQAVAAATTQATPPAPAPTDKKILLDDFDDFTTGIGERLNLKQGQIVYFTLYGQEHSITVKEIGDTYVVVTIASEPTDVRLTYGSTVKYDVDGDNQNDILLTAYHIDGQAVTIMFQRSIGSSAPQTLAATTDKTATTAAEPQATFRNNPALIFIGCLVIAGAGGLLFWLIRKQRKGRRVYRRVV